jgi:vacuolar-type H+-ATPase subunit I/STV1
MAAEHQQEQAIFEALKAIDEVAAALQAHLVEEHGADPNPAANLDSAGDSITLLRHARERLSDGLRSIRDGDAR